MPSNFSRHTRTRMKHNTALPRRCAGRKINDQHPQSRRAGRAERENQHLVETKAARERAISAWKEQAGYGANISFDEVWEETLEKAKNNNERLSRIKVETQIKTMEHVQDVFDKHDSALAIDWLDEQIKSMKSNLEYGA